ncbi:DUF1415 domain-containing protein [Shewanella surugensis]|uniref:DUF1415 domain-containing protein n=1 Tax=Shewanella surugensis TaxID=212020 RepID=A0ABT0L7N6_9GAMM|nr:DUF1415 domain-containing protein [Shewanella surugensis]MCL1123671.1 DUF1415 domain-containing protein [Shewanella surugensis]
MQQASNNPDHLIFISHTEKWVKDVIMKYNICPFARKEVEKKSIRYVVIEQTKIKAVLKQVINECLILDNQPAIETSLLILPRGFEGFYTYLDLVELANDALITHEYESKYQLASFHPDYCFDNEPQTDPANFTNRSPYPTLHIIREASMEKALADYTDPESIPERNIAFARKKGSDFFEKLLAQCSHTKK